MELADIFRQHRVSYIQGYSPSAAQCKVADAIMKCRTAALGGHLLSCQNCDEQEISYNSCRNRHCPKCQGTKAAKWVSDREKDLLAVRYFHTVFTLPSGLNPLVQLVPKIMYDILFKAVSKTLLQIGKNNLGCEIGAICILHTWGSSLTLHPHIHCLIPACGIKADGTAVRFKKKRYFVSDKILAAVFRGKFIELFKRAYRKGKLAFHFDDIDAFLNPLVTKNWVVKTKLPFRGPSTVLKYLARYTHRVAISNQRIVTADTNSVTFRYKAYKCSGAIRTMKLHAHEFLRRFLQHCLPHQFFRIRHYGFLSNQKKAQALDTIRAALGSIKGKTAFNAHKQKCCHCNTEALVRIIEIAPDISFNYHCNSP